MSTTALLIGAICLGLNFLVRYRTVGKQSACRMGVWNYQLRVLDRYWSCRNAYFSYFILFRQKWRTGIARFAEGMTIFAVMTAGIFPLIHTGRPWLDGYLFPYPNQHSLWVNFTSPLLWDVFAVSTYFTVSFVFW